MVQASVDERLEQFKDQIAQLGQQVTQRDAQLDANQQRHDQQHALSQVHHEALNQLRDAIVRSSLVQLDCFLVGSDCTAGGQD